MNVLCVGEMMVDIIVRPVRQVSFANDSAPVDEITVKSGGDANNNAIDLCKLGNTVKYVGRVGNDVLADHVVSLAREQGVDMSHIVRSPDTAQTKSLILIDEQGDRTFLQFPGTSAQFSLEDVDLALLDWADILQIGGTFHLPLFDGAGAAALLRMAQEKGIVTSMDVTSDRTGRWNEIIEPCYPHLDYFLPSIEQAELIARTSDPREIVRFFQDRGVKNVAVKLGRRGSYCAGGGKAFFCACYDVPVVETTGAGDAFVSGFLTGVGRGFSLEDCVRFGTAASAFVIQAVGATTGMGTFDALKQFIEHRKGLEIIYDTEGK